MVEACAPCPVLNVFLHPPQVIKHCNSLYSFAKNYGKQTMPFMCALSIPVPLSPVPDLAPPRTAVPFGFVGNVAPSLPGRSHARGLET